jgi:hypothetical protein
MRHDVGRGVDVPQCIVEHRQRDGRMAGGELVSRVRDDLPQTLLERFRSFQLCHEFSELARVGFRRVHDGMRRMRNG